MVEIELPFESVRALCRRREVDLVLCRPPPPFEFCLHGEFDGYGDFFWILAAEVEFVEIARGFPVGELLLVSDMSEVVALAPKWIRVKERYSPPALVIMSADSDDLRNADPAHLFLLVAERLVFRAGADWARVAG